MPSGNGKDGFFNPFSGLKKQMQDTGAPDQKPDAAPAAKKQPQAQHKNAGPAGTSGAAAGKASNPQNNSAYLEQTMQDAEDAALFLSAMQSTPRYVKSYSTDSEPENSEPDMAALLNEAGYKRVKRTPPPARPASDSPARITHAASLPAQKRKLEVDTSDLNLSPEDADSFAQAMQGVLPVDGKGRDLAPAVKPAPVRKEPERDYMADVMQDKFEFALEYTEEFFEGHVMGLDPLVIAKMRSGQYSPESYIDLHGLNTEQAYASLLGFIRHSYNQGLRSLIVVTGRGKNSPGGFGVLRQHMQDWLTKDPLKRVVLAFCTAQPRDGGAGALYVMLRKHKKSSGKIRWDRSPSEEAPLL